jgi:hypothetical protein
MFTRSLKRFIARASIAAVMFTQLAVAVYACPTVDGAANIIAAAIADDMHAAMPGCEMRDTGNPNLCLQHCQAGDQSVETLPHVTVPALAAISTLAVIAPAQPNANSGIAVVSVLPEHATSPPPLILFGVIRI